MDETNYEPQASGIQGDGLDIASMVLGILSILCCWVWFFAWIPASVGLVLGIMGLSDKKKTQKGFSIAGIITSGIGLLLTIVTFVILIVLMLFSN